MKDIQQTAWDYAKARGNLIEAADDMLAALVAVRARFQNLRLTADHETVLDRVDAAISKAKGDG